MGDNGYNHFWYAEKKQWFDLHGININALPPFQYSLDCPHLNVKKLEKNRMIWTDIIKLD